MWCLIITVKHHILYALLCQVGLYFMKNQYKLKQNMKYSLILQNVVSKEISIYELEDKTPTSVYFKFEIELKDQRDGEYEYILFPNEDNLPVDVCENNVFRSTLMSPRILVTYNDTLSADTKVLCGADETEIAISAFGLFKIGDYQIEKLRYNKPSNYVVYERN